MGDWKDVPEMADVIVVFKQDKVTKNKIRFTQTSGDITGSIYVEKDSELINGTGEIWLEIQNIGD